MRTLLIFIQKILPFCCLTLLPFAMVAEADNLAPPLPTAYNNHVLVSDGTISADFVDPNLVNAWGLAFGLSSPVWVADNGTGKSTLYDGTGKHVALVVTVPGEAGETGKPTGIVASGGTDFVVSVTNNTGSVVSGPSRFIFATESGTIAAWAPAVSVSTAVTVVDNSSWGASYKGLAYGGNGSTHLLYASDFHNGRVDVFDSAFKPVALAAGAFVDPRLPPGFAPFGIQAINGDIYVTYAKQDADAGDEIAGAGLGFVDAYDPNGKFIARVASRDGLNAPWGLALAPASFGMFGGALLVGNFGDGTISAFDPISHRLLGVLQDKSHHRIVVDGLWGIAFGNGVLNQMTNALYYAAGPDDESHGAYGVITAN